MVVPPGEILSLEGPQRTIYGTAVEVPSGEINETDDNDVGKIQFVTRRSLGVGQRSRRATVQDILYFSDDHRTLNRGRGLTSRRSRTRLESARPYSTASTGRALGRRKTRWERNGWAWRLTQWTVQARRKVRERAAGDVRPSAGCPPSLPSGVASVHLTVSSFTRIAPGVRYATVR